MGIEHTRNTSASNGLHVNKIKTPNTMVIALDTNKTNPNDIQRRIRLTSEFALDSNWPLCHLS